MKEGEWYQTPYLLDLQGAGVKWILPASARDKMKGGDTNGWYPSQTNPLPPRFASIFLNRSISCLTLMTHSDERNRPMTPAMKPYVVEKALFKEVSTW